MERLWGMKTILWIKRIYFVDVYCDCYACLCGENTSYNNTRVVYTRLTTHVFNYLFIEAKKS